jgi:hypothetical protein
MIVRYLHSVFSLIAETTVSNSKAVWHSLVLHALVLKGCYSQSVRVSVCIRPTCLGPARKK